MRKNEPEKRRRDGSADADKDGVQANQSMPIFLFGLF
jgi:hypothetical protein